MDRILLLCCRSCLRGDGDNNEYYEVLGLPDRHVSQEAIKKAFKKTSLNLHPDKLAQRGIEQTPESKQMFLKVKTSHKHRIRWGYCNMLILTMRLFPLCSWLTAEGSLRRSL